MQIGLLHPGAMGVTVGQAIRAGGHEVLWCSQGRGAASRQRALDFTACEALAAMLSEVDGVISVCPPDAALAQAQAVVDCGYQGVYVDANAVAPATAQQIAETVGAGFVDGGLIGPPAKQAGTTRLYLSGEHAAQVAMWFADGVLDARVIEGGLTAASTLKMAYAAYTKGSSALLLAVNALAARAGVHDDLVQEWALSQPGLQRRSEMTAQATAGKAWRFVGEMQEIAKTFEQLGLPGDFHRGAALLFQRMSDLKDQPDVDLAEVLETILSSD